MITNERQYKLSSAWLRRFQEALIHLNKMPESLEQPWLREAQKESIEEQIDQLKPQIVEYERLKSGKIKIPDPVSIVNQAPLVLIRSRIANGWDQEELASRLGMAKQQIQRYEQNNYAQATISVMSRVAAILTGLPDPARSTAPKRNVPMAKSSPPNAKSTAKKKNSTVAKQLPAKKTKIKRAQPAQ
jgi:transcriptional regulator with XRE-family HTH domain